MTGAGLARATLSVPRRLLVPEGIVLGALLALPWIPAVEALLLARGPQILAAVLLAGVALGWRFARGRVIHGLLVLTAAAALPLLEGHGVAAGVGALLVPLSMAVIALLPDRGILTRGGLIRTATLTAQAAAVAALALLVPAGAADPLATVVLPGLATPVDTAFVAYGAALVATGLLAAATGAAPARGSFWATLGALAAHLGAAGGSTYVLAAAGSILIVATLEDAYALAYRDALTGLPSRRALDELLERTGRRFTVAMVDVDHFKAFNDRHGHDVGDQVLRLVATKLRQTGGGARAFRYGGEEFTLVFRGRAVEDVRPHLDAVREAIAASEFVVRSADRPKKKPRRILPARRPLKKLKVTVSIGAAERRDRSRPATEAVAAADAALYRAKDAGRNRVVAGA